MQVSLLKSLLNIGLNLIWNSSVCSAGGPSVKPTFCKSCGTPPFTSPDSDCVCPSSEVRMLRKYACGPACDAIGYCCAD